MPQTEDSAARTAFEAWARSLHVDRFDRRHDTGEYMDHWTQHAWEAWKAAHAAADEEVKPLLRDCNEAYETLQSVVALVCRYMDEQGDQIQQEWREKLAWGVAGEDVKPGLGDLGDRLDAALGESE